jgi:hypothetical protein
MIARRLAAVAATIALIVGAIVVRDRLIEGDGTSDTPPSGDRDVLVCATELADVCRTIELDGTTVVIAEAGATLDELASDGTPGLWMTFAPFPEMVDSLRVAARRPPLGLATTPLASSPIALVVPAERSAAITAVCPTPTWPCLAGLDRRTGFARTTESGTGLLGVAQAALGYSPTGGLPANDAQFEVWLRNLVTSVSPSQLSGGTGTAIDTIQSRPSSMDIAVGAEAQLSDANRSKFDVTYAEPMIRADVVLAALPGTSIPSNLTDQLSDALVDAGWARADASGVAIDPSTLLAIRALWEELS